MLSATDAFPVFSSMTAFFYCHYDKPRLWLILPTGQCGTSITGLFKSSVKYLSTSPFDVYQCLRHHLQTFQLVFIFDLFFLLLYISLVMRMWADFYGFAAQNIVTNIWTFNLLSVVHNTLSFGTVIHFWVYILL